jgi:hypothetical protein
METLTALPEVNMIAPFRPERKTKSGHPLCNEGLKHQSVKFGKSAEHKS